MLFTASETPGSNGMTVDLKPSRPLADDKQTHMTVSTWLLTELFPKHVFMDGQVFDVVIHALAEPPKPPKPDKYDISS